MTELSIFTETGKLAFTQRAARLSICEILCCEQIPRVLIAYIWAIQDISPTTTNLKCQRIELVKQDPPNDNQWIGHVTAGVWGDCTDPDDFEVRFQCDDDPPVPDKNDCNFTFSIWLNGFSLGQVEVCCCAGSTIAEKMCAVADGFADALNIDPAAGQTCGFTSAQDTNFSVWVFDPASQNDPCCKPDPCPPDICPDTPCDVIDASPLLSEVRLNSPTLQIDYTHNASPLVIASSIPSYQIQEGGKTVSKDFSIGNLPLNASFSSTIQKSTSFGGSIPLNASFSANLIKAPTECACEYCNDPYPTITACQIESGPSGILACCTGLIGSVNTPCAGSGNLCWWDSGFVSCDANHTKRFIVRVTATEIQGVLQIKKSGFGIWQVNYAKSITPDIDCDARHDLSYDSETGDSNSNPCTGSWNGSTFVFNPAGSGP